MSLQCASAPGRNGRNERNPVRGVASHLCRTELRFVCDTVQLAELFGKLFQPETPQPYVSCEEMAMLAVQAIKRRLVPKAKKIRVQISPMPDRWAAATKKW